MATDPGGRSRVAIPAEFDDIVIWAAWLYYEQGLNQSDIAQTIGVSRASVVNYLQEARERGVVRISMDPGVMAQQSLARGLAGRFGLAEALVVPVAPGSDNQQRLAALGAAGARQLERMLTPGETLCVSWGKTVLAVADAISQPVEGVTVAQVTGAAPGNRDFSAELCTAILARNLGAVSKVMHAPAVLSDARLCEALRREPVISQQFALIRAAQTILFGIGSMGPDSTMRIADIASAEEINAYAAAGAEAVLICRFLDAAGRQVRREFDQRMMGIELDELKAIPRRICVAGGLSKLGALRAALQAGYISHLVTDVETASALAEG
ncbi:sugar-binding transcriptional regulator [Pseudogemmobacter faecipullorum]|uniref:Sugar-binding transcriptional regulator n=1 Tax=Pseudogemmobacter faecipullorum TaxID=2755041 RepID=A0ABS8CMW5_9RHOB|nr:sugar-binding domain-containing protein [Pseudogemmobacter faecipullorum]MCB5410736.1 sugar-binding transcriptional regulator [Pseudogemmobacter faecipullorum]